MVTSVTDTVAIQANQFPIKSVKLFSSGNAEITRTFPLPFLRSKDQPQIIEIVRLPAGLQSVDVSVTSAAGNVTILDHYQTSVNAGGSLTSQTLRELEAKRLRLQDERRIREENVKFLTTYMDSLAQCKSKDQDGADQMITFFDEFVDMGIARSAVIAELNGKLADVGGRIEAETDRLSKLSTDLPIKVVVVLQCNGQVLVEVPELTLTYVVKQVSWKPEYDLHVSMTENIPLPTVTLDFRCKITQWTGENWDNVSLALTTVDHESQLIRLPEPKRIDISLGSNAFPQTSAFGAPMQPLPHQASLFGSGTAQPLHYQASMPVPPMSLLPHQEIVSTGVDMRTESPVMRVANDGALMFSQPQGPQPPQLRQVPRPASRSEGMSVLRSPDVPRSIITHPAPPCIVRIPPTDAPQTVSELVSQGSNDPIVHIASGSIFIPSDHAAHHVLVASLPLQAEFIRVVVPNVDARVFYTCEVKNTSEYVLLPGTVKTYLNDKHVSSTKIQNTESPQTLECSLAIDTGVKTIHNRAPDALPSGAPFTGTSTTTYTSATVLHNTRTEPIRGVVVRSSVPLPADPRITIVLKEPAGLAEIDQGHVRVKEGCLARWSTSGGRKGKQAGLFEWVCDMNPGTEVLRAVWEVCTPQGLKLVEQTHPENVRFG